MSSFPYVATSNVFNTADYNILEGGLTIEQANRLYLSLSGGTVIGNISTSNLSATSTVSAPIINSSQYLLSGSPINFSAITGVSAGTATANKALILDGAKEISTLNAITSNNYYGTTANIQFMNCDIMTSAINCNSQNFYSGGTIFINSTRDMSNINTLTFAGTKRIQDVQTIDFNLSSLFYKSILRKSTVSGNAGLEIYDTQFSGASHAMLSFIVGNATSNYTSLKLYSPYNLPDVAGTAFGQSFQFQYRDGPSFGGGLAITTTATNAGTYSEQDRINLSANAGAKPYLTVNPLKTQLHLMPQGLAELNTTYVQNVICGEEMLIRKYLCIGTSQDTARMLSILDSGMVAGDSRYLTIGYDNALRNQAEISFYLSGSGSTSNRLDFGFYGGASMFLTAQGRLGVGTSSPRCPFEVNGANSVTTTTNIAVNTYFYNISNNTYTNGGGGPYSATLSAIFSSNIWVQDKIYCTSDRRLKKDIIPLDFTLEHYKKINPVSYKWKNDIKPQLGLIAQEVKEVCSECINIVENENMVIEQEGDIQGAQYTVDYNAINMMNVVAIKKLIERVELLENELKNIKSNIP